MSDLISRKAVIKLIHESADDFSKLVYGMVDPYDLAFKVGHLPSAEPEQKWIPCSERLPENKGKYLTTYHPCYWDVVEDGLGMDVDTFQGKSSWAKRKHHRVIAWMPLPEPYKEGEK